MKIAAVVILFHPDETVISNIKSYYGFIDKVYVFDNTETAWPSRESLLHLPKVEFYQDFENKGIAHRLNTACDKATAAGFEWLLTMDQDTSFANEEIGRYITCFNEYKQKETVALFGPEFNRGRSNRATTCSAKEADKLITSGSLLNLSLFEKIGRFDEALFIDTVDYDYCFRAKIAGYALIQFSGIYILHPIGKQVYASSVKTLFLVKKKKEIHSPVRCYYMYRNMLYLKHKYKNYDSRYYKQIKGYVLSRIKVCILYGRQTFNILRYLRAAKTDFKNNRMGKISTKL